MPNCEWCGDYQPVLRLTTDSHTWVNDVVCDTCFEEDLER